MFVPARARCLSLAAAAGLAVAVGVLLPACGGRGGEGGGGGGSEEPSQAAAPGAEARAELVDAEGRPAGSVALRPSGDRVEVQVRASRLAPGFHGFHVHESGVCDPNAREEGQRMPFASAGAHYARGDVPHGEHAGDLPPLLIAEDGTGSYTVVTERFDIDDLVGGDGTAFVVHAEPDNVANIPGRYVVPAPGAEGGPDRETLEAGDSGDRVACGKVTRA